MKKVLKYSFIVLISILSVRIVFFYLNENFEYVYSKTKNNICTADSIKYLDVINTAEEFKKNLSIDTFNILSMYTNRVWHISYYDREIGFQNSKKIPYYVEMDELYQCCSIRDVRFINGICHFKSPYGNGDYYIIHIDCPIENLNYKFNKYRRVGNSKFYLIKEKSTQNIIDEIFE